MSSARCCANPKYFHQENLRIRKTPSNGGFVNLDILYEADFQEVDISHTVLRVLEHSETKFFGANRFQSSYQLQTPRLIARITLDVRYDRK